MRFAAVHRNFACGVGVAADVPRAVLGSWLRIYLACTSDEIESARLEGAVTWTAARWMRVAGVEAAEVQEVIDAGLGAWDGDAFTIAGFDDDGLTAIKARRAGGVLGAAFGKLGGRPRKNPSPVSIEPLTKPLTGLENNPSPNPSPNATDNPSETPLSSPLLSLPDPQPPAGAPDPKPPAPDPVASSGADIARLFGRIRCEVTGAGVEWQGTPTAPEKAATMAASITAADAWSDVEPAMRSFWQQAKAGKLRNADQILRNPSFAFGCWCSEFHGLREALHGKAPAAPPDTSAPRCAWHKLPGTASRRAHHPSASCVDCRHLTAAAGTRESEPTPIAAVAPPREWTEAEKAEAAALIRRDRTPPAPKRITIELVGAEPEPKA